MILQTDHGAFVEDAPDGAVDRFTGILVEDMEYLLTRLAPGLWLGPTGQGFGHRVHKLDVAVGVGGDHGVADALEGGGQPLLALLQALFGPMFVEGHLDGAMQFSFFEGFEEIAEGLGDLGSLDGGLIGVGGEVDDRDIEMGSDVLGGLDAVHLTFQPDVHQHQIWVRLGRLLDRLFS